MPKSKVPKLILPERACTDVRFHRKILGKLGEWPAMQRTAFIESRFEKRELRRIVYDLDVPKVTVRILIFYAEADICLQSLLYCIRYGRPPRIEDPEQLYRVLYLEDLLSAERLAEEKKDAIFDAIKRKIADMPSKEKAGG